MLKRHQILLNDWLADFIKSRAAEFDLSFSENIRLALCLYYLTVISELDPSFKTELTLKKVMKLIKDSQSTSSCEEERHKVISELYFEARKAMEHYTENIKGAA